MKETELRAEDKMLLSLLRSALWGEAVDPALGGLDDKGWRAVYNQACRQSVQGIVSDVVCSLPDEVGPGMSQGARWVLDSDLIARRYARIKSVTDRLAEVWKSLGIVAVHLKGTSLAEMYPVPEHRVCGDVDWYFVSDSDRAAAGVWAVREGLAPRYDSDGTLHYMFGGVIVEHHHLPFDHTNPMEIIVMLNLHILKHAIVLGVGLRQLCDLAVAYYRMSGAYNAEALKENLRTKGLLRWTGMLHCVLTDYIGLPEEYLPWPERTERMHADARQFVGMVLKDGNFGQSKNRSSSGMTKRIALLLRYAPSRVLKRFSSLAIGRIAKNRRHIANKVKR